MGSITTTNFLVLNKLMSCDERIGTTTGTRIRFGTSGCVFSMLYVMMTVGVRLNRIKRNFSVNGESRFSNIPVWEYLGDAICEWKSVERGYADTLVLIFEFTKTRRCDATGTKRWLGVQNNWRGRKKGRQRRQQWFRKIF